MRHFLNRELLAANVMTVPVDRSIVAEFAPLADGTAPGFESCFPGWNSDIEWRSPSTPETHRIFESAFERMRIGDHVRQYLDLEREVRLYAGFLVIRSECSAPKFHLDWFNTDNQAFTMLTPLSADTNGFNLLYKKLNGDVAEYEYRLGEAVIFGDHFSHSTKPARSQKPVALLCFEFGTDKMEHWEKIYATIGGQTGMLRRPDGEFMRTELAAPRGYSASDAG
jgi:hypothetical protein